MNESSHPPSRLERSLAIALGIGALLALGWALREFPAFLLTLVAGVCCLLIVWVLAAALWLRGLRWFWSRRAWRFYGWLTAGIVSVVVLFYAEESWRGKRAWARLQREAAARGEKFELASVVPPPVPDDQNFALAPGMASLVQTAKNGHVAFPFELRRVQAEGAPEPPETSWAAQKFTDLAGWQNYFRYRSDASQKAGVTMVPGSSLREPGFPVAPRPQAPAADVLLALSQFERPLSELRLACQRPASRMPLPYELGFFAQPDLPSRVRILRNAAQVLSLRAAAELAQGRTEEALQDVTLALRLAEALRQEPFFLAHLARNEMLMNAVQPVWEGLAARRWSEPQLQALEAQLKPIDLLADFRTAVRGETVMILDLGDRVLSVATGRSSQVDPWRRAMHPEDRLAMFLLRWVYPVGWLYQDKAWVCRQYEQAAGALDAARQRAPSREGGAVDLSGAMDPFLLIFVAPRLKQMFGDALEMFPYVQTAIDEARVACALERHRLGNGQFPETLQALVPRYLDQVPADIMSGQPLQYRRTEDGRFVLYSLGWNQTDDGGRPGSFHVNWRGRHGLFPRVNSGDWVWTYPRREQ